MNIKIAFSALLILIAAFSCKKAKEIVEPAKNCEFKDQKCDSAIFMLGNQTKNIIYFGMGSNMYEDSLLPKEVRAIKMGHVDVTYDKKTCERKRKSWSTCYVHSSEGDWAFDIDHCMKVSNFGYGEDSIVRLYDDTSY